MILASAYPSSAISAGAMMAIAFVMTGVLAFWIAMVYLADRQRARENSRPPADRGRQEAGPAGKGQGERPGAALTPAGSAARLPDRGRREG